MWEDSAGHQELGQAESSARLSCLGRGYFWQTHCGALSLWLSDPPGVDCAWTAVRAQESCPLGAPSLSPHSLVLLLSFSLASSAPGSWGRVPPPQRRWEGGHTNLSSPWVFSQHQVPAGGLPHQLSRLLPDAHQLPSRQLPGVSGRLYWHDR